MELKERGTIFHVQHIDHIQKDKIDINKATLFKTNLPKSFNWDPTLFLQLYISPNLLLLNIKKVPSTLYEGRYSNYIY